MSVNKDRPHVLVLPEDDANLQIANGFHKQIVWNRQRQMQVLAPAGGWLELVALFTSEHARDMERWPNRLMILAIDFDGRDDRLENVRADIPHHLTERVFVLGSWTEPEQLKATLGPYETIGGAMATDCREGTDQTWGHVLLRHNAGELERLRGHLCQILFLD